MKIEEKTITRFEAYVKVIVQVCWLAVIATSNWASIKNASSSVLP